MKQFRVGSISMGLAFVLLGVALLLTEVFKLDVGYVLLSWWPIIFILLGIEMLVYLFKRKEDQVSIKFDFLSILFVGIIGMVGICLTVATQLGLVDLLKEEINRTYQSTELPSFTENLNGINKVMIDTNNYDVNLYGTNEQTMEVYGNIEGVWSKEKTVEIVPEDYIVARRSGDILFVALKNVNDLNPYDSGMSEREVTFLLPTDIKVETIGDASNEVRISSDVLTNDWHIQNMHSISVSEVNDFYLTTSNIEELVVKGESVDIATNPIIGTGNYGIKISNTYEVKIQ